MRHYVYLLLGENAVQKKVDRSKTVMSNKSSLHQITAPDSGLSSDAGVDACRRFAIRSQRGVYLRITSVRLFIRLKG